MRIIHKWNKEEDKFLIDNLNKFTTKELSSKININYGSICRRIRILGLKKYWNKDKNMRSKYDINEIKRLYLNNYSSSEICDILKIKSYSHILRMLKRMNVPIRSNSEAIKLTYKKGRVNWRKGLTKETSEIVRNSGIKISKSKKGKRIKSFTEEHKKKIGEANRRRIWKEISKEKISKSRLGNENPNWNGGTSFIPYNKHFNNKFKRLIRKRDNQVCMLCGIHREKLKKGCDIHHIDYNKLLSIQENCISLCNVCHSKTNANRKHWTKFFQSLLSEKYGYQYSENLEPILNLEIKAYGKL